jgi:hypothetical protein
MRDTNENKAAHLPSSPRDKVRTGHGRDAWARLTAFVLALSMFCGARDDRARLQGIGRRAESRNGRVVPG